MSVAEFTFTHQLVAELGEGEGRRSAGSAVVEVGGEGKARGASSDSRGRERGSPSSRDEDGDYVGSSWIDWILRCSTWVSSRWTRSFGSRSRVRGRERHHNTSFARSLHEHSLVSPTSPPPISPSSTTRFTYPRRTGKGILARCSSSRSLRVPVPDIPTIRYNHSHSGYVGTTIYDDDDEFKQEIEMEDLPSPVSVAGSGSALVPKRAGRQKIGDG